MEVRGVARGIQERNSHEGSCGNKWEDGDWGKENGRGRKKRELDGETQKERKKKNVERKTEEGTREMQRKINTGEVGRMCKGD